MPAAQRNIPLNYKDQSFGVGQHLALLADIQKIHHAVLHISYRQGKFLTYLGTIRSSGGVPTGHFGDGAEE